MASNERKKAVEDEQKKQEVADSLIKSALRRGSRVNNVRELGTSLLKNLPTSIPTIQKFMKAVNWAEAQGEVQQSLNNTIAIVGLPNTGKSTLFNKIKGQQLSPVSSEAGTTRALVRSEFGPFTLIDTPGHLPDVAESGMKEASVIVFLMDATRGLRVEDRQLYENIKTLKKPIILAVNKVDTLKRRGARDQLVTEVADALGEVNVIPISARTGENIAEELIPEIIKASPDAALVIGRELPAFRHEAAQRIIRNSTLISLVAGMEPIPLVDIPILLGTQIRLVLRIAALYGEPLDSADFKKHARELLVTMAGGLGMRYLAEQAAKIVPYGGDAVAGIIAGAGTWAIGQVALEYYEGDKQVNTRRLRQLYADFYQRFRKVKSAEELRSYALEGKDAPLLLQDPKP
ncbi:MAG TPA: GTP-binding protein [Ktedonobacteraceae bacterium]|nr:GTP-binding protein [Ktedonobacteraceae bacterium]